MDTAGKCGCVSAATNICNCLLDCRHDASATPLRHTAFQLARPVPGGRTAVASPGRRRQRYKTHSRPNCAPYVRTSARGSGISDALRCPRGTNCAILESCAPQAAEVVLLTTSRQTLARVAGKLDGLDLHASLPASRRPPLLHQGGDRQPFDRILAGT